MARTATLAEPVARHRLSVADFHKMGEAGILTEDDRVELIEGELVDMAPIGSWHASVVADLTMRLAPAAGERAIVSVQNPVRLGGHSEPQPDVTLLHPREDRYRHALPTPSDVLLLIEVADSSAAYDRVVKIPLYARHGVPEVWLIELGARRIEVYRRPGPGGYGEVRQLQPGETLSPEALPQLQLTAEDLLG